MEGRPVIRNPGGFGRRSDKTKAKSKKREKQADNVRFAPQEKLAQTPEEIANRTFNILRNLGTQRFALPPFDEHVERWLSNLKNVLYEFETNYPVSLDDQFTMERSQILHEVELNLKEDLQNRAASELAYDKNLSDAKGLLERIEEDHVIRKKDIDPRSSHEITRLSNKVGEIEKELDDLAGTKTGIFEILLRRTKAQKEAEALQRLESARRDVASAEQNSVVERQKLRDEFEVEIQPVKDQIMDIQKRIAEQEVDGSVEIRRAACDSLINSMSAFLGRSQEKRNP